jgi:hypothetical protein
MCSCAGTRKPPSNTPKSTLSSSGNFKQESIQAVVGNGDKSQMVNVEYLGVQQGTFSIRSKADPRVMYRFGANDMHRVKAVFFDDVPFLLSLGQYRVVSDISVMEQNDPANFIGQPITA